MYGNFILDSSPSTFNDSIRAYKVMCVCECGTKLQKNSLGAADSSWNRGRPVSQVVPRGVSPCPDIGGMQKYEEFAKKINIGYAMSKVCYEKEN